MNITTTPLETEYGPKLELAFKYDPTIIAAVKTIEGRWYHGDRKTWSIPAARLDAHPF